MTHNPLSRDDLAEQYLESLVYQPYPFQEDAILAWYSSEQGVLVCAPTGMGKTLIAEAALFEAIKTGKTAYYTTPLIALTEQKFRDLQATAVRWGCQPTDVGLVTGNRRENPEAKLLVVVAEILFNRLLHTEAFDFRDVSAVVMDEFHSFNDPERGIVWEFALGLLPGHVRTLLLSATVGNAYEFVAWLRNQHHRRLELVQSNERKVPLTFEWVGDKLLTEHLESMAEGDETARTTPALVFCFNRDGCWAVAEQIQGKKLIDAARQKEIAAELEKHDWSAGAGPKLRQILLRGVGVHHAGVLPRYRRIVEDLFQRKLLSIALCTETLAAGINLPARSVVLPTILKGPMGKKKIVEPSAAHQIFGRAGRPQYDVHGYVFALAHEDDVRLLRWKEQYDQIPETTKDPKLLQMKKKLKKKMPKRSPTEQYWTEAQFQKLCASPPGHLASRGRLPWRLLAYMLQASPEVAPIRQLIGKRLMDPKQIERGQKTLDRMLLTLGRAGYVTLDPAPPEPFAPLATDSKAVESSPFSAVEPSHHTGDAHYGVGTTYADVQTAEKRQQAQQEHWADLLDTLEDAPQESLSATAEPADDSSGADPSGDEGHASTEAVTDDTPDEDWDDEPDDDASDVFGASLGIGQPKKTPGGKQTASSDEAEAPAYKAVFARPTPDLQKLLLLRSVNPLYGSFLVGQLGIADRAERLQAFESVLELPSSVAHFVRPPSQEEMPPGPLATGRLDAQLLRLGLATAAELVASSADEENERPRFGGYEPRVRVLSLAEKLRRLFQYDFPFVDDVRISPAWIAGEVLEFGGDFNKYVTSRKLQKQEGIVFRHLLRMILLLKEFADLSPPDVDARAWRTELRDIAGQLSDCCRRVDQSSTDEVLEMAEQPADIAADAALGDVFAVP